VANNLFEECNGEVEIISSKTNFNVFRNNVFYKSEGSLVTRHGNYCTIDGNYFIGDENSDNIGGIRLINTGHWVTNNYFYKIKGKSFRSPIAVMNGIPKSPLNRYNQVTDVVIAYNNFIDCPSPWQFGVGTNISQKEVLPLSEIRSARPTRTVVANNLIYNTTGDENPIVEHDKADGVLFKSNLINNQGVALSDTKRLKSNDFQLTQLSDHIFVPQSVTTDVKPYDGFEFETITKDLFGNSRTNNAIGAISGTIAEDPKILDKSKYGTSWFASDTETSVPQTLEAATSDELITKINEATNGDVIVLSAANYEVKTSLVINKILTIQAKKDQTVIIKYMGQAATAAFEMNPKGELTLQDISLVGTGVQYAFASLEENMSSHYNLTVSDVSIRNFDFVLKAYKETFAEEITFSGVSILDCENGLELSQETNDKGDYNVEFLTVDNCTFENVKSNVIDYYRGGYDESTIGGNLILTNSTFTRSGSKESSGILLSSTGIVNVDISNNTFTNNKVKLVARLWGAKNNTHANNTITNSGKIIVEENLKLKLVY
jgi:poly(beta-D-mannuronate) lyase